MLGIHLNRSSSRPLHKQLEEQLTEAILSRRLAAHTHLPSTYELAHLLSISRATVVKCYARLLEARLIFTKQGSGTFVSEIGLGHTTDFTVPDSLAPPRPRIPKCLIAGQTERIVSTQMFGSPYKLNESVLSPPPAELPVKSWKAAVNNFYNHTSRLTATSPRDCAQYLNVIASFLCRFRGIKCSADNLLVYSDVSDAYRTIIPLLVDADSSVVYSPSLSPSIVENIQMDRKLRQVTPDCDNIDLRCYAGEDVASMNAIAKFQLLRQVDRSYSFFIEDDSSAFFNYGSEWYPAISTAINPVSSVYLLSFREVLHPLTSLTIAVVSHELKCAAETSTVNQFRRSVACELAALSELIGKGLLERHLAKLQKSYFKRRQQLIFALATCFRSHVQIDRCISSSLVTVRCNFKCSPKFFAEVARSCNLDVTALECDDFGAVVSFKISFTQLDEHSLFDDVQKFAQSILESPPDLTSRPSIIQGNRDDLAERATQC